MKKNIFRISTLAIVAIFICIMVFYISCKKKCIPDCSFTQSEQNFFSCFNNTKKIIFKNDTTNVLDTLTVSGGYELGCPGPCTNCPDYDQKIYGCVDYSPTFSLFGKFDLWAAHGKPPFIEIYSNWAYDYTLNIPTQTVSINGTTYNDVYSVLSTPDSATINSKGDKQKIPWKIYYSQSHGFVRFYMMNGQTWSKL